MISLITSLKKIRSPIVIIELIDRHTSQYYKALGIPADIIDLCEKNRLQKKDQEKSMTFYGDFFGAKKLIVFFPQKKSLMDDRSEVLKNISKKALYIPACEYRDALETLTLSTYSYDVFLTKKEEKSYEIYVPLSEKKSLESHVPLLEAITRARDIINLPPTDTRPEAFIEHIRAFKWKNFKLRIIDAKELKKLGCNLLLGVGSGSDYPPYMVILERILDKKLDTYALIGK